MTQCAIFKYSIFYLWFWEDPQSWTSLNVSLSIWQLVSQDVGKFYASGGDGNEAYKGLIINITT
jgi:hypothetical protein|tara:strand:+ start:311 stop:502 length:192 start_codon:yes stop_codon:yes gene_type:complete